MTPYLASAAAVWLGVIWAYVAVMHARAVYRRDGLSLFWKVHILPLAVVGLALDAVFNAVFGSLMFVELPHELLFTKRVQRHARGNGARQRLALWWARNLNVFDEGHVDL